MHWRARHLFWPLGHTESPTGRRPSDRFFAHPLSWPGLQQRTHLGLPECQQLRERDYLRDGEPAYAMARRKLRNGPFSQF